PQVRDERVAAGTELPRAPAGLAHHGEGLRQQGIPSVTLAAAFPELGGLQLQPVVREPLHFRVERVDAVDDLAEFLQFTLVLAAEYLCQKKHNLCPNG